MPFRCRRTGKGSFLRISLHFDVMLTVPFHKMSVDWLFDIFWNAIDFIGKPFDFVCGLIESSELQLDPEAAHTMTLRFV